MTLSARSGSDGGIMLELDGPALVAGIGRVGRAGLVARPVEPGLNTTVGAGPPGAGA